MKNRHQDIVAVLPNIRRFAASLCGNIADADDLLQMTVERLLTKGLPDEVEVLPWSLRVCRNLWIDDLRSRKVRREAAVEIAEDGEPAAPGERQVIGEIMLEEVQDVLLSMSEEHRSVLELVAVEGCSYKEAAEILDLPIGTVMSRLARARVTLIERSGMESPAAD